MTTWSTYMVDVFARAHTHTHTYTLTHLLTYTLTHLHTYTHARTHARMHAQADIVGRQVPVRRVQGGKHAKDGAHSKSVTFGDDSAEPTPAYLRTRAELAELAQERAAGGGALMADKLAADVDAGGPAPRTDVPPYHEAVRVCSHVHM